MDYIKIARDDLHCGVQRNMGCHEKFRVLVGKDDGNNQDAEYQESSRSLDSSLLILTFQETGRRGTAATSLYESRRHVTCKALNPAAITMGRQRSSGKGVSPDSFYASLLIALSTQHPGTPRTDVGIVFG